jgi:hypothetical protein
MGGARHGLVNRYLFHPWAYHAKRVHGVALGSGHTKCSSANDRNRASHLEPTKHHAAPQ